MEVSCEWLSLSLSLLLLLLSWLALSALGSGQTTAFWLGVMTRKYIFTFQFYTEQQ